MQLALVSKRTTLRDIERVFQLTFVAADNYVAGGVVIDFTKMVNSIFADRGLPPAFVGPGNNPPAASRFVVNQDPSGYSLEIIRNPVAPTLKNYLAKIYDTHGGGELAVAGIPAGITGDVNQFTFSLVTPKKYG